MPLFNRCSNNNGGGSRTPLFNRCSNNNEGGSRTSAIKIKRKMIRKQMRVMERSLIGRWRGEEARRRR
jgi:hypothetical protein